MTIIGPYYEALNKLSVGEISGLIETRYGFHIAKLLGRHPYDEAKKELIRNAILERKRLAIFNEYFEKLKKKYKISSNLEVIK